MTITLIQGIIFVAYISFLLLRFKRSLPSISDSWYKLGKLRLLFTLFCWSLGVLMVFQTDGSTGFFFLSGAGLCFTGTAAAFKETMTYTVHFIGAYVCILGGFVALIAERDNYVPLIVFCLLYGLISLFKVSNKTWWVEIPAFLCLFGGLLS